MIVRAELASRLYAQRRARDRVFGDYSDGFGEPAWDLMLALYVHQGGMPVEQLRERAGVKAAIADRYVEWMKSRELLRVDDGHACLSMEGRGLIDAYLERVWGAAGDEAHGIPLI